MDEFYLPAQTSFSSSVGRIDFSTQIRVICIAAGAYHSAAIDSQGKVYTWGCNVNGQLGREESEIPGVVEALSKHRIIQISLGLEHSLALTETSHLFAWGANFQGQLGLSYVSAEPISQPQELSQLCGLPVRQICAGGNHSLILTTSGSIYTWGSNEFGQLGVETNFEKHEGLAIPNLVKLLKNQAVAYIACGESHSAALTNSGKVFTFGSSKLGQLGHIDQMPSSPIPKVVDHLTEKVVTQISCGRFHTFAFVPASGKLYSFGSNMDGQLGHGSSFDNPFLSTPTFIKGPHSFLPKEQIESLSNTTSLPSNGYNCLIRIYSGGDHNFIITTSPSPNLAVDYRKWTFWGLQNRIATLDALLLHRLCEMQTTGDDSRTNLATHRRESISNFLCSPPPPGSKEYQEELAISGQEFLSILDRLPPLEQDQFVKTRLGHIYSSLACLSACCLVSSETRSHFNLTRKDHGLDIDLAYRLQHDLFRVLEAADMRKLTSTLLTSVLTHEANRSNFPGLECLRAYIFLLVCPLLDTPRSRSSRDYSHTPLVISGYDTPYLVLNVFAQSINQLDSIPSNILDSWLATLQPRYLRRLVVNLNNQVAFILVSSQNMSAMEVMNSELYNQMLRNALDLMKRLHTIIDASYPEISYTTFYIPEIKDVLDVRRAFINWIQERSRDLTGAEVMPRMRPFNICDYAFIFDGEIKMQMLALEAQLHMKHAVNRAQSRATSNLLGTMFGFNGGLFGQNIREFSFGPEALPVLQLTVNRNSLVKDTMNQLSSCTYDDLKKPLNVKFTDEEAVDQGGVMKEFFLLIMRDVLDPIYGMFVCNDSTRMIWFSDKTMESERHFGLVGILCGLAIYNSIIVDLCFPLALFKKLQDVKPNLDDLKDYDPELGASFEKIIDYEDDDLQDVFCLDFSVTQDYFGECRKIDLVEDGRNIAVTQANKLQYVEAYVDHFFNKSVEKAFNAFKAGFHGVCSGVVLKMFRPIELQSLVVGTELYDWGELRANAHYEGEYWDRHPVIEWFWDVLLREMSLDDKKKFLRFLTGCDRVPIWGLKAIKINIQPSGGGDSFLPAAHTCFNLLDLPKYSTKDLLRTKLLLAIQQTEGFALV
ncbi:putative E3 ubiquitin-protein ligase herc4 [Cichlidogyrus casuarinus]|uniref:E3 ubiquitin-protein ligase herc4 n=1 Tax=Cichlidogyrus casuarinus TaxID=1844966 RepID=A0ABD2PZ57_9PLAT